MIRISFTVEIIERLLTINLTRIEQKLEKKINTCIATVIFVCFACNFRVILILILFEYLQMHKGAILRYIIDSSGDVLIACILCIQLGPPLQYFISCASIDH